MSEYLPYPDTKQDIIFAEDVAYEMDSWMDRAQRIEGYAATLEKTPDDMHHQYWIKDEALEYSLDYLMLDPNESSSSLQMLWGEDHYIDMLHRGGTGLSINPSSPLDMRILEQVFSEWGLQHSDDHRDSSKRFHRYIIEQRIEDPLQRVLAFAQGSKQPIEVCNADITPTLRLMAENRRSAAIEAGDAAVRNCVRFRELKVKEATHSELLADFATKPLTWSVQTKYSADEYHYTLEYLATGKELCMQIADALGLRESELTAEQRLAIVNAADEYFINYADDNEEWKD